MLPKDYEPASHKYTLNVDAKLCKSGVENIENPYSAVEKLGVHFFTKQNGNYHLVDSVQTDATGKAVFKHNIEDSLYYTIRNENVTNISDKCVVKGVFLTQSEIDSYPKYDFYYSNYKATVGGYKLQDRNGDGKVNENDTIPNKYIPVEDKANLDLFVYEIYYESAPELWWSTEQDISNYCSALSGVFGRGILETYTINKRLSANHSFLYPALSGVGDQLYGSHYQYVNRYRMIDKYLPEFSPFIRDLWETKYKARCVAYDAIMHITMVDYFGAIPLITTSIGGDYDRTQIKRDSVAKIERYVEESLKIINEDNEKYGVMQVLARHYLNEGQSEKALRYVNEIINSDKYALASDTLNANNSLTNSEVIMTGTSIENDYSYKATYLHAARYTETLLIAAEANFKVGKMQEALKYYNMLEERSGFETVSTITLEDIQNQFEREMRQEGQWYTTNGKRWDRLKLFQPNAEPYNNLLPLPFNEINMLPNVEQNPGYK